MGKRIMGIDFQRVTYSYDDVKSKQFRLTLDGINLHIESNNEFIAVLGHTGSGKSTMIQHMNALLTPLSGEVVVFGTKVTNKLTQGLKEIRKNVGIVFQFPEYQLFEETVLKDIMFGPKNFGLSPDEAKEKAIEASKSIGVLEELLGRSPFTLSGGQMRRVAIAGVLASMPRVLILDEPTVGLDPKGKKELMSLLQEIQTKHQISIIIVTHDMNVVSKYVKRTIVLSNGKVVFDGDKFELFQQIDLLKQYNLDLPEISQIAISLSKQFGFVLPFIPLHIEELVTILSEVGESSE
jgi:energy-coupling factor transport system ATP-binding protein